MKNSRQTKIVEIIKNNRINNQNELIQELEKEGFKAAQATISRDIKELNLIKVRSKSGDSYFSLPGIGYESFDYDMSEMDYVNRIETIFRESVVSIDHNNFLIVIKTLPGMAQAAAHAIDTINWSSVLGTIAGDDTIFVSVREESDIDKIIRKFRTLKGE